MQGCKSRGGMGGIHPPPPIFDLHPPIISIFAQIVLIFSITVQWKYLRGRKVQDGQNLLGVKAILTRNGEIRVASKKRSSKKIGRKWVEKHEFGHAKMQKFSRRRNLKIIPPVSKKSPKYADHPPPPCWTRICSPDCIRESKWWYSIVDR